MDRKTHRPAPEQKASEATQSLARGTEPTLPPTPRPESDNASNATEAWFKRPAAAAGDLAGKTFGDYELLSRIGRGGMGVVYQARQRRLNRVVALKMIRSGEFAGEDEIARFYETKNRPRAAVIYYNEVLWQDPGSGYAEDARRRIDRLQREITN